jgi:hypothetical protein
MSTTTGRTRPEAACPIRDGDPCSQCVPGVTGPQDCGLVWLVMNDPELREEWRRRRAAEHEARLRDRSSAA